MCDIESSLMLMLESQGITAWKKTKLCPRQGCSLKKEKKNIFGRVQIDLEKAQ